MMQYPTVLEHVFKHFSNGNEVMTMNQYVKFAVEVKLLDKKASKAEVGHIFVKAADPVTKLMDMKGFKGNFTDFANKKKVTKNEIVKLIEKYGKKMFYQDPFAYVKTCETYSSSPSLNSVRSEISLSTMSDFNFRRTLRGGIWK